MEGETADSSDPSGASKEQRRRRGARWMAAVAAALGRGAAAACLGEELAARMDKEAEEVAIYGGGVLGRHDITEIVAEADTASARVRVRAGHGERKEKA